MPVQKAEEAGQITRKGFAESRRGRTTKKVLCREQARQDSEQKRQHRKQKRQDSEQQRLEGKQQRLDRDSEVSR